MSEAQTSYEIGLAEGRREHARVLLQLGYGTDFTNPDAKPPTEVLEEMVRLAAGEMAAELYFEPGDLEGAYYVLSSELGDWRNGCTST